MGDVPTKPGDHYWRARCDGKHAGSCDEDCIGPWEFVMVGRHREEGSLWHDVPLEHFVGGEWGERIPGNEVLKARRELAAQCPLEGPIGALYCRHCGHKQFRVMEQDEHGFMIRRVKIAHAPDCPWLRAQED